MKSFFLIPFKPKIFSIDDERRQTHWENQELHSCRHDEYGRRWPHKDRLFPRDDDDAADDWYVQGNE